MKVTNGAFTLEFVILESGSQTVAALSQRVIRNVWELLKYEMLKT
jgi:hypothetical protein